MRELGYYWCKYDGAMSNWEAMRWDGEYFHNTEKCKFLPIELDEINETRILNPDEQ